MGGPLIPRPHSTGRKGREKVKESTKNASKLRNTKNILNVKEVKHQIDNERT